jgi:hypothetical protein
MAKVQLLKLSEKGASNAPTLYSAGMQWRKWAEKYRFGSPQGYAAGSSGPFRTVSRRGFLGSSEDPFKTSIWKRSRTS